jgi:hypothetical protein
VASSIERSQALLRDLSEMPPAHQGRTQPPRRRLDMFSAAMRQAGPTRRTPLDRLIAGDFQLRLALLLGATLLAVLIIAVLT